MFNMSFCLSFIYSCAVKNIDVFRYNIWMSKPNKWEKNACLTSSRKFKWLSHHQQWSFQRVHYTRFQINDKRIEWHIQYCNYSFQKVLFSFSLIQGGFWIEKAAKNLIDECFAYMSLMSFSFGCISFNQVWTQQSHLNVG